MVNKIRAIDIKNYIGEHTANEIENFEKIHKKPIYYLSKLTRKSKIP